MNEKALIRKRMLAIRSALTSEECKTKSKIICERFLESKEYALAHVILLYKAYNNEVGTDMIFKKAVEDGKTVAYPVSQMINGEPEMTFYVTDDLSCLIPGYKGIPEPDTAKSVPVPQGAADICIAPGVAFDSKCHRIGYGKAFYDRYIRLHDIGCVIALAYDVQITDDFETGEHERALDMVITDNTIYRR